MKGHGSLQVHQNGLEPGGGRSLTLLAVAPLEGYVRMLLPTACVSGATLPAR